MSIRLMFLAVLTVLVVVLAACGGGPGTGTTASAVSTSVGVTATTAPGDSTSESAGTTEATVPATKGSDLLTVADVEKVSGLTGLKNVEMGALAGAGGDVNFATAEDKLVLMANFYDGAQFDALKGTVNYREALAGLGDEAFVGPSKEAGTGDLLYIVAFKKGDHTAVLVTYFKDGMKDTMLSIDQLKQLAGIVASRW